jgi:hypothetical protein
VRIREVQLVTESIGGSRRIDAQTVVTFLAAVFGVAAAFIGTTTFASLNRADAVAAKQYGVSDYQSPEHSGGHKTLVWDESTFFEGKVVRVLLVSGHSTSPNPPGVSRLPQPGRVMVSPALRKLLASPSGPLLKDRIPGEVSGIIAPAGLTSEHELRAYVGIPRPSSSQVNGREPYAVTLSSARVVNSFTGSSGTRPASMLILALALTAALLPVIALTAAAVRMRSLERDSRLVTLWLLGISQRELRTAEAARAAVVGLLGCLAGVIGAFAYRGINRHMNPSGFPYSGDQKFPMLALILIGGLVILVAASTTGMSTRWAPEDAFLAVRSQPRRYSLRPLTAKLFLASVAVLALLICVGLAAPRLVQGALILEYAGLLVLVISAGHILPYLSATTCGKLARKMGVAGLVAGERAFASPSSVKRGLAATTFLVLVAPALQGVVALTDSGAGTETVPGVTTNHVVVSAPKSFTPRLESVAGARLIGRPTASDGVSKCGPRYPCLFTLKTNGNTLVAERVRNTVGWQGFVNAAGDPPTSQLYGWSSPRSLQILKVALLASAASCEFAIALGILDAAVSRRRANAALFAVGFPKRSAAYAGAIELFIPAVLTATIGLAGGVLVLKQLTTFLGRPIPFSLPQLGVEAAVFLGTLVLVLATALPSLLSSGRPEDLRVTA